MWKSKNATLEIKDEKIERIARQFRNALDAAWEDDMFRNLYPFNNFPMIVVGIPVIC